MKSNNFKKFYKTVMLILLTAVITFLLTSTAMQNNQKSEKETAVTYVKTQDGISATLQTFRKFISEKYMYDVDDEKLLQSAIKGYIEGLDDQYSEYITKDEMNEYMESTLGNYVGIGVYLTKDILADQIVILAPIKGSPAEEAGLQPNDVVKSIDGVEYKADQLNEASAALKKEEGTKAKVEIFRNGDTFTVEVERKKIKINHVESKMLNDNIGYIEMTTFDEGTCDEFVKEYNNLSLHGAKQLIIDLRGNGGGIVSEAINIADLMVEKNKTLLITMGKNGKEDVTVAKEEKTINIPVVILIDEGTASSSEILAAAIKENNENIKIVGKQSYGKGVIQTLYTLNDGSGLKLTTNEYLTPNRNTINKKGIVPDYYVELPDGKSIYSIKENEDTQLQKAVELLTQKEVVIQNNTQSKQQIETTVEVTFENEIQEQQKEQVENQNQN